MTNQHYRLLVTDIDGTLITRYGDVSAENRQALALARRSGIQVSLSTGRSLTSSMGVIKELSLDSYHIFFDGALAGSPDTGEEIYVRPIDKTVVMQMTEFARAYFT